MYKQGILGLHLAFYYYGCDHLFINMYQYIREGIENKELIFLSMEPTLYNQCMAAISPYGIDHNHVTFYPVEGLINLHQKMGMVGLRRKINQLSSETVYNGYKGIRWIGQPAYAISQTSKKEFLAWEKDLTRALEGSKISLLCIYDVKDYCHQGHSIDHNIIDHSFYTHRHLLYKFRIEKL